MRAEHKKERDAHTIGGIRPSGTCDILMRAAEKNGTCIFPSVPTIAV
jgi:hypothetical protein